MKHVTFSQYLLCFALSVAKLAIGDDQFVFSGFTQSSLTLDGCAIITEGGLLDLSNGTQATYLKGLASYPTPLHFRRSPDGEVQSFSITFVFSILGTYSGLSDDGMAFFIAPTLNFSQALPGVYYGLFKNYSSIPSNHIFAIELDTYQTPELKDIDGNHVGIDINSPTSFHSSTAGFYDDKSGVFKNMKLISGEEMQLWVDYNQGTTQISVTLAPLGVGKPSRPLLSASYNLSTVLKDPAYVGFSAAASPINMRDYVLGWSLGINKPAPSIDISKLPKLPRAGPKDRSKLLQIVIPIVTVTIILTIGSIIIIIVLHVRRRRRYAELREDWEVEFGPHRFSYKDLFHATQGFKKKHLLGAGGFGKVYKGVLPSSNLDIAVKRMSHDSRQGMKEFISEIVSLGRLRHRNLVPLLGYCRRKGELFLVYDYMPSGSLDKYLHCGEDKPTLNWPQRFQVVKGVASGLLYLHEEWEKIVIHRDIKASNVLLDSELNGRLGDFGLARLYDHGTDPQATRMAGTTGYLAPELVQTGKASPHTDVFAFGMFLLEVTCGQRPVNQSTEEILVDWVLEHWNNGSLTKVVDTRLQGDYNADKACTVLKLGLLCLHPIPSSRPSMREVLQFLDGNTPLPELRQTELSLNIIAIMQNNGLDTSVMSYPQLMSSFDAMSDLSGGR